ncbi:uncharacterized protein LOC111272416 isoform X1 [Varroa jacobsoni]|uniref:uncharacterized protein LOC111272416 isoform X1 n=1 Tax=Varroa jacobsoni TaxID=62625 RepID=UPI000BF88017|nr:uncharacterized protein LOC111272416 isoform X1 [Varroa jacobsoni]
MPVLCCFMVHCQPLFRKWKSLFVEGPNLRQNLCMSISHGKFDVGIGFALFLLSMPGLKILQIPFYDEDCGILPNENVVEARIANGMVAGNAFPWTVIVASKTPENTRRHGTGALVTPFHVLTAAHLVPNPSEARDLSVLYGSDVVRRMKSVRAIGVRYATDAFRLTDLSNDVVLLLLENSVKSVPTLCVPPARTLYGSNKKGFNASLPNGCGLVDAIEPVQTLVVDGEFAENKFPWTVLVYTKIGRNLISYGTGALITPLHVLTAAHLLLTPGSDVVVLYGSNLIRLMKPVSVTGIRRISSHFKEIEDIMLLLLETELNNISRLCVPSWKTTGNDSLIINLGRDFPKPGDNITIAGFGALSESIPGEGGELPKELMYTTETVLPNAYCEADTEGFDSQTAFCAKSVATGICRGDSGASAMLLVQQRLVAVGIAASSRFCGYSPDRYIRVAVYLEWLHTSINDSPKDFSTPE